MNTISSRMLSIDMRVLNKHIFISNRVAAIKIYIPTIKLDCVKHGQLPYVPIDSDFHSQR